MKKKQFFVLVAVLLIAMLALSGCGQKPQAPAEKPAEPAEEVIKVGFIYVSPVGDAGWTYAHDRGRQQLVDELGVETRVVENVAEGPDAERVMTQLIQEGSSIIFATSFGFMDSVINVAQRHPEVTFLHCSGYKTAENVGTYFGRMYQPRYLSGLVAGSMTQSNIIGYVAAHPIPEVIRGINAFTLGVRAVNPDAEVRVVWSNTWYNPAAEKDAAISLLDAGADVIAQHQDTPGPQQAAQERGAFAISYNTDMRAFAPDATLTGPIWNWGPFYVETVKAIKAGTWTPDQYWGGLNEGIVDLAPFNDIVPDDVRALVAEKRQLIESNEWDVFTGEIKDQAGEVKVADGVRLTDEEMLSMNWFVQGVVGTIPR